eukprot:m.32471 g.32471  ORF g.32471 m.32471 type:complete len:92 (-) comp16650_c0_seq1:180-455(-)
MSLEVYIASVSGSLAIRQQQQKIDMVLSGKHIEHTVVDIATTAGAKDKMREMSGDPKMLPPQFFKDGQHLGGYDAFSEAIEDEELDKFLKL